MDILNPIVDAASVALDSALEPEARLQSLMRRWLGNYFTGVAFPTRSALLLLPENKTFMACDFMWQEDETPKNPQKPLIHVVFSNVASERRDFTAGTTGHNDRWQMEVMIKVPVNLTGTAMEGQNAEFLVRRLAGQVQWLLGSGERQALSVHGVNELRVERPPVLMPGTSWHMRMLTASCLTRREQSR
jgi:hypothetical protein